MKHRTLKLTLRPDTLRVLTADRLVIATAWFVQPDGSRYATDCNDLCTFAACGRR